MSRLSQGNTIFKFTIALVCIGETLVSGFAMFKFQKYHVIILNGLQSSGSLLGTHCKSGDDDLGFHELALNKAFQWEFRSNLFMSTLYFCGFSWSDGRKEFVAWKDNADFIDLGCGGRHCTWKAQEDGIYLFNIQEKVFKLFYNWDKSNLRNSSMTMEIV